MARFEVLFQPGADLKITVNVEPDEDEDGSDLVERAIALAHERIPEHLICAKDSGWGQEGYSLDVSGTDIEPYAVYDGSGTPVFEEKTQVELLHNENQFLDRRIRRALTEVTRLRNGENVDLHEALKSIEWALRGTL